MINSQLSSAGDIASLLRTCFFTLFGKYHRCRPDVVSLRCLANTLYCGVTNFCLTAPSSSEARSSPPDRVTAAGLACTCRQHRCLFHTSETPVNSFLVYNLYYFLLFSLSAMPHLPGVHRRKNSLTGAPLLFHKQLETLSSTWKINNR